MTLRAFSSGGGVQSIAALVLSVEGRIDYPLHLFCNVGEDSENPDTLIYVHEIAMPYAAQHGIAFVELRKVIAHGKNLGQADSVYRYTLADNRTIAIPMRTTPSGAPGHRECTTKFKVRQINKAIRARGATKKDRAIVGLGISFDEVERMSSDDPLMRFTKEFPLIDLRLRRDDCKAIIRNAGLPIPPKSSCYFCPFQSISAWRNLRKTKPDLFDQAVAMEQSINEKRARLGRDAMYFVRQLLPIDQAVDLQADMFDDLEETCETGFCLT